jgi:hypothetical protein
LPFARANQDHSSPVYTSHIAAWQAHTITPSSWLRWGLTNLCLSWPQAVILLVSASGVAEITSMSLHLQQLFSFFKHLTSPHFFCFVPISPGRMFGRGETLVACWLPRA